MENILCPYCKQGIEFEEGKCRVCTLRNHLWTCKKHRQLNKAKEKLFNRVIKESEDEM